MLSPLVSSTTYERFVAKANLVGHHGSGSVDLGIFRQLPLYVDLGPSLSQATVVALCWSAHTSLMKHSRTSTKKITCLRVSAVTCVFWNLWEQLNHNFKEQFEFINLPFVLMNKCNVGDDAYLSGCSLALNRFSFVNRA